MAQKLVGKVVSAANPKTITIQVDTRVTHPVYKKQYTKSAKFYVHDEKSEAKLGDKVEVEATRPVSKTKNWKLISVLEHAKGVGGEEN